MTIDIDRFHSLGTRFGYMRGETFTDLWVFERIEDAYRMADKFNSHFGLERPAVYRKKPAFNMVDFANDLVRSHAAVSVAREGE